jgi:glycosyltransferase involved in cell wall biosynthesis
LPVIASGTGNITLFMQRGDCGWTYTAGDSTALAAAVERCETSASERLAKGANARLRWQQEFTAAVSQRQLESIYDFARQRVHAA